MEKETTPPATVNPATEKAVSGKSGLYVTIGILVGVLLVVGIGVALVAGGVVSLSNGGTAVSDSREGGGEKEDEEDESDVKEDDKTATTATIEGSLSYPSEFIPEDMSVCAEGTDSTEPVCTSTQIKDSKYKFGTGYKLEVPAGTYTVYAYLKSNPDYRAYYNEFVTCGLSVDCKSHKTLVVEVKAGETVVNVDPIDWYNM